MAVESPAAFIQASTYSAEVSRRAIYALLQRGASIGSVLGGLVALTDMQITAGGGMQVLVGTGEAVVPGSTSATQSGYYGRVSSSTTLAIAASDATNPRVDRVSAIVKDAAYSGAENTFTVAVETGTPTAGATLINLNGAAAAPASSLTLGYVLVPAKAVSVEGGNIANVATQVQLGPPGAPLLKVVARAASFTGVASELAKVTATATDTLPPAVANALHGVATTAGTTTITASGGAKIYGDFINAAGSITLLVNQHVILQSDGTNWFIVAGEPKREGAATRPTKSKAECEAGVEFSATRPAYVTAGPTDGSEFGATAPQVGGVLIINAVQQHATSFIIFPGEKYVHNKETTFVVRVL